MADISQITLPSNKVFNIKDASARQGLSTKVDIAQGASNANKYLVTDENGNIVVRDLEIPQPEDDENVLNLLTEFNFAAPVADADGNVITDADNNIILG